MFPHSPVVSTVFFYCKLCVGLEDWTESQSTPVTIFKVHFQPAVASCGATQQNNRHAKTGNSSHKGTGFTDQQDL